MLCESAKICPRLLAAQQCLLLAAFVLILFSGCEKVPTWDQITGKEAAQTEQPAVSDTTAAAPVADKPAEPAESENQTPEPAPQKVNSAEIIATFLALPEGAVNDGAVAQLLKATEGLEQIVKIRAPGDRGLSSRGLELLVGLPALADIDLTGTKVDDNSMASLAKIPTLEAIRLNATEIGDEGLNHLVSLPGLKILQLAGCGRLTPAGLAAIGRMPAIEEVVLNSVSAVNNESLAMMSDARTMRRLHMNYCSINDAGLLSLRNLDVIEELIIAETSVTGEGLAFAAKSELQSLKKLSMFKCPITLAGAKVINRCKNLEHLAVGSIGMDDKGFSVLTQGMTKLTYLHVKDCKNFVGSGLKSIKGCANMETLYLRDTGIVDQALPLMKGFRKMRTLELSGTNVTQAAAQNLKAILPECNITITGHMF